MAHDTPDAKPCTQASDGSLVRRFRHGEQDAATELYLRYADRLEKLAQRQTGRDLGPRVDAEDVVQSVFRTFFRRAAQGQYDLPAGEELWRLILVIALNKIRQLGIHHRAAKRSTERTKPVDRWDAIERGGDGKDATALATLEIVVDELLSQLPEAHRTMIVLRIEGHEVAEIAERTERSQRSVERVLQNFRQQLSALIHDE
ncbi:MAG: sigma-70 family RNA polymerase sigma factor [Planctomycetota bacterium]|nr:MAG: sigma-70 family RNA polymerase sigma factor [Planctomycetota bacterium]